MIRIKRGLDIPIAGEPRQEIEQGRKVRSVAVLGGDYPGMKPTMLVSEGDHVKRGQALFEDKKNEGVLYTAPAAGRVRAINRGHRRMLLSVVIDISGTGSDEQFTAYPENSLGGLDRDKVQEQLVRSGQWTALRTRPFGKVPALDSEPEAIFVSIIDTNPLAPRPDVIIAEQEQAFRNGLAVLSRLTEGTVWVGRAADTKLPSFEGDSVREEIFEGPHPAGNVGTHIHFLHPVSMNRMVWTVGYQDVIAIGHLFASGRLHTDRVVALAGPQVSKPRLLKTRLGASLEDLTDGELTGSDNRIISGSVFNGHNASGPTAWLGQQANQVTVLEEGNDRKLFGYLSPGLQRHSSLNIYLSKLMPGKRFEPTTSTNGSERAMVPLGQYEAIMPLDILPTQLLRALVVGDLETAQALGALELVEEDLALCTYNCVGKYEYGPILRDILTTIEAEG
ncbi:Na(+)-translocating NADH-quinone reductase subunit A [Wenzhouxiangella sp. AB-CW3]|uniref:Na(+)-translocating NADH-quinone reductase subunit A n=1 Tax=Wenzhouxiangella sp. AB-CW3 TaxID=2771012 RepID=UPI00168BA5B4|nr:Na(+)-translocating NADH-quinone reductase subunit A [Wenzhouxiangella sp. AB-CW3]QOC21389.1 Na(+)-translocating NADH-quinone reductase subunit A [Wenzhouxiangella sp. AB-CW3]